MGTNDKAIKNRIRSVRSTKQLAAAVQLVASAKFRRAENEMQNGRQYLSALDEVFSSIPENCRDSVFVKENENEIVCIVMIAGDRGLAGGFNNAVFRQAESLIIGKRSIFLPIGKRAYEYAQRNGFDLFENHFFSVEEITEDTCTNIAQKLAKAYKNRKIGHLCMVYSSYQNVLSQEPTAVELLPIRLSQEKCNAVTEFEPDVISVLDAAVPEYISGMIYGAVKESVAAELSARRNAMDSASKNAGEMIDRLTLAYNRARQSAITQEIIEIVAGSNQNTP